MPDKRQSIREAFLTAAFRFLGYIAHCDGPINRSEIHRLKVHMKKMNLPEEEQRQALHLFKSGTAPDFDASQALQEFRAATTPKLIQILLVHLITMARADGYLMEKELHAIQWIARELGYKSIVFNQLLKIIYTQDQLALSRNPPKPAQQDIYNTSYSEHSTYREHSAPHQGQGKTYQYSNSHSGNHHHSRSNNQTGNQPSNHNQDLQKAYAILGVTADMTDDEIRRIYKRLASQLHPDKLMSQELPQDQIDTATERFKRVQAAFSFIKKHRSIYGAASRT